MRAFLYNIFLRENQCSSLSIPDYFDIKIVVNWSYVRDLEFLTNILLKYENCICIYIDNFYIIYREQYSDIIDKAVSLNKDAWVYGKFPEFKMFKSSTTSFILKICRLLKPVYAP